jgi:sporadic carbohydrate cluster 2OG-Fe(II) oxygenase
MTGPWSYLPAEEAAICQRFLDHGHVILPAEDLDVLKKIRDRAAELAAAHLKLSVPGDPGAFLDAIHHHVDAAGLNALRLAVIQGLNESGDLRRDYHALCPRALSAVVGNELAMQRRVNLSVQLPGDESSLLPVHSDVWSGDSPFEVVLWVPLVDCHDTKSMYLLPPAADAGFHGRLAEFHGKSSEDLYQAIAPFVSFLTVPFGSVLLFSQNLMHGNRVNAETSTRWSMNCRFKAVLAPYGDKRLGEFFEPLVIRPATRLGMQ